MSPSPSSEPTSIVDRKTAAEIDKLRAEAEKIRVDKIFQPLAGIAALVTAMLAIIKALSTLPSP